MTFEYLSSSSHNMERLTAPCAENEADGLRTIIPLRGPRSLLLSMFTLYYGHCLSMFFSSENDHSLKTHPYMFAEYRGEGRARIVPGVSFHWCKGFVVAPPIGWAFYYGSHSWSAQSCFAMLSGKGNKNDRLPHTFRYTCQPQIGVE